MSRRPKPSQLKMLQGNPGKRPLNLNEPQPDQAMPEKPSWLDATAGAYWNRLAPALNQLGVLTSIDGELFAAYCVALATLEEAQTTLQREGLLLTDATGNQKKHPAVGIAKDAMMLVKTLGCEFGLSPSSRSGVVVKKPARELTKAEIKKQQITKLLRLG